MPDPDRDARQFMDAPGTRVTPAEPDEHLGRTARSDDSASRGDERAAPPADQTEVWDASATPDDFAGHGRAGDTGASARPGIGIGATDDALAAHSDDAPPPAAIVGGSDAAPDARPTTCVRRRAAPALPAPAAAAPPPTSAAMPPSGVSEAVETTSLPHRPPPDGASPPPRARRGRDRPGGSAQFELDGKIG
jgi:hypothetical protein